MAIADIFRIGALGDVVYSEPVIRALSYHHRVNFFSPYASLFLEHPVLHKAFNCYPEHFVVDHILYSLNWVYEECWRKKDYGYIPDLYLRHFNLTAPDPAIPQIYLSDKEKSLYQLDGKCVLVIHPYSRQKIFYDSNGECGWSKIVSVAKMMGYFTVGIGSFRLDHDKTMPPVEFDLDLRGKTNLRELCAIIHRADRMICTESGPLAIADAMDKTGVALIYNSLHTSILHPKSKMTPISCHDLPMDYMDLIGVDMNVYLRVNEIVSEIDRLKPSGFSRQFL